MHSHSNTSRAGGGNVAISLSDISMKWDRREVLADVNLDVCRGDFLAITGPNGGGKSTLLSIMLGLVKPSTGTVSYFDPESRPAGRLHIGYLPQKNKIDSHFPINVHDVVASGLLGPYGRKVADHDAAIGRVLDVIGLADHAHATIGALSGGQLQRALLGRAIISEPEILVLDEPLSYLDKHFEQRVYDLLRHLAPTTTIVLVSHEMTAISAMATRHLIVDRRIHECESAHHFVTTCE